MKNVVSSANNFLFNLLFSLMAAMLFNLSAVQSQDFDWAAHMGGDSSSAKVGGMVVNSEGDVLITGQFDGQFMPDTGGVIHSSALHPHMFIQKVYHTGITAWSVSIGGYSGNVDGTALCTDETGNVYIGGTFLSTVDFDPGTGVSNLYNFNSQNPSGFVLKLDSNGEFLWAKEVVGEAYISDMVLDKNENLILTGHFYGMVDFDPSSGITWHTAFGDNGSDIFLFKLDSEGVFYWARAFGDSGVEQANDVAVDKSGDIYFTGKYSVDIDFNPSSTSQGYLSHFQQWEADVFIAKFSSLGDFQWVVSPDSSRIGHGIDVDELGNCYVVTTSPEYGSGIISSSIYKLHGSTGQRIWRRTVEGNGDEQILKVKVADDNRNLCVIGSYTNELDFGGNYLNGQNGNDGFMAKLDSVGNVLWLSQMGDAYWTWESDHPKEVDIDADGDMYAAGMFSTAFDFDPSSGASVLAPYGDQDVFLVRYACGEDSMSISDTSCISYLSPSGLYRWYESGVYYDTISNASGCDIYMTIDLVIDTLNTGVSLTGVSLISVQDSVDYAWFNCGEPEAILSVDQEFFPMEIGYYAVVVTRDGCTDTSECEYINIFGLSEKLSERGLELSPNPVREILNVAFETGGDDVMDIRVLDAHGRQVLVPFKHRNSQGSNTITLNVSTLSTGVYFLEAKSNNFVVRDKFVVD